MKSTKVGLSITMTIVKIAVYIGVAIALYNIGKSAYSFGYSVFSEEAMASEPGRDVTVTINSNASVYEIGKVLERKGLIRDASVFYVQEMLSENRGKIIPGTYILNTSYDAKKILSVLCQDLGTEETDENGNLVESETS